MEQELPATHCCLGELEQAALEGAASLPEDLISLRRYTELVVSLTSQGCTLIIVSFLEDRAALLPGSHPRSHGWISRSRPRHPRMTDWCAIRGTLSVPRTRLGTHSLDRE